MKHFREGSASGEPSSSYQTLLTKTTTAFSNLSVESLQSGHCPPHSAKRTHSDDSWDLVDDLPLRWATDFVPLASPGTRLANASVVSYALFSDSVRKDGQLLAIATKSTIFLYETPRGERAFRFVKVNTLVPIPLTRCHSHTRYRSFTPLCIREVSPSFTNPCMMSLEVTQLLLHRPIYNVEKPRPRIVASLLPSPLLPWTTVLSSAYS